jgi:hypothetical protein
MLMKVGSTVRVIRIPDGLEDYPDFPTKSTFGQVHWSRIRYRRI